MSSPNHKPIIHTASIDEPQNHLSGSLFRLATMSMTSVTLYAAGSAHYLFAIDRMTGQQQHMYESLGSTVMNPLVVDGILYATTATNGIDSHGIIEAWRLSDSTPLWHFSLHASCPMPKYALQ